MIVWRTDTASFKVGEILSPRGDHLDSLDDSHHAAEMLLRKYMPNGEDLRINSVYAWREEEVAQRMWALQKASGLKSYLYKLVVEQNDIRHIGDLNFYTELGTALTNKLSPDIALKSYTDGLACDAPHITGPRFEVLVKKATVLEVMPPAN